MSLDYRKIKLSESHRSAAHCYQQAQQPLLLRKRICLVQVRTSIHVWLIFKNSVIIEEISTKISEKSRFCCELFFISLSSRSCYKNCVRLEFRDVRPMGWRRVRTPPHSENFQFFPMKMVNFIEKKDHKIEKECLYPLTFLKQLAKKPFQL